MGINKFLLKIEIINARKKKWFLNCERKSFEFESHQMKSNNTWVTFENRLIRVDNVLMAECDGVYMKFTSSIFSCDIT